MSQKHSTFPLRKILPGPACNCSKGAECPSIGKHPACNWTEDSVPYEGVETEGVGIRTGQASGFFVLDIDVKPAKGINGFNELAKLGGLPATRTVLSPSGGKHYYFLLPDFPVKTTGGVVAPGIDVRGEGGMVAAPHSPHKTGGRYKLENPGPIAAAPQWLLERLQAQPAAVVQAARRSAVVPISKQHKDYGHRVAQARGFLSAFPPCVEDGQSSKRLMTVAHMLMVKLELPLDKAAEVFQELYNTRCEPEWSSKDVQRALVNASTSALTAPGVAPEGFEFPKAREVQPVGDVVPSVRRVHNPDHQYTFKIGQAVNGKTYKAGLAEVMADLTQLEEWAGVLQYDEFSDCIVAVDPPVRLDAEKTSITDNDINAICCWFEVMAGKLVHESVMSRAIDNVSAENTFHPVRDYLKAQPTKDIGYLDEWIKYVFGDIESIQVDFVKKSLVGAIRRVFEPGCFVKSMLVLYGSQDAGKSSLCKKLFGEWFKEDLADLKSKDAAQELLGVWGLEMSEMDTISRAEIRTVKSFVSRAVDKYRPSYGRKTVTRYRQNVFVGTTNEDDFLRDATGSTRFWPVEVPDSIPTDWSRDEVWSAAYQLYLTGYSCFLETTEQRSEADDVRKDFQHQDAWTESIEKFLINKAEVTAADVLAAIVPDASARDNQSLTRVRGALKQICGKSHKYFNGDRRNKRYYIIPPRFKRDHLKTVK